MLQRRRDLRLRLHSRIVPPRTAPSGQLFQIPDRSREIS
jgi:hypothetical protein